MGFCSRCGEPCALATCSCGGYAKSASTSTGGRRTDSADLSTSAAPAGHKVLYTGRSVTPDTDRWERKYVQRSPATTPKTVSRTLPGEDTAGHRDAAWTSKRTKHLSLPTYAMSGAHAPDEYETLALNDAVPGARRLQSRDRRVPSSKEVQEVEETISRTFGSVLDPAHQRHKWSCHDCKTTFVRDQTVYPDPRAKTDASLENILYCPRCFSEK